MLKRVINIFLILVLAVQMLPIQQMGKMLFCSQFTEEIPHCMDNPNEHFKQAGAKSDFISTPLLTITSSVLYIALRRPVIHDAIPQNHAGDIHVPPPNTHC